jgi:hypothetical protein
MEEGMTPFTANPNGPPAVELLNTPSPLQGGMSDYVATRWYRAPELLVPVKDYGLAGTHHMFQVWGLKSSLPTSRYVVRGMHISGNSDKTTSLSWN